MLKQEILDPAGPWTRVVQVLREHTKDPLLVSSLYRMITLQYRFDHIQYITRLPLMHLEEDDMIRYENTVRALLRISKIRFAMAHYPVAYEKVWSRLYIMFKEWERHLLTTKDEAFAFLVLHEAPLAVV